VNSLLFILLGSAGKLAFTVIPANAVSGTAGEGINATEYENQIEQLEKENDTLFNVTLTLSILALIFMSLIGFIPFLLRALRNRAMKLSSLPSVVRFMIRVRFWGI